MASVVIAIGAGCAAKPEVTSSVPQPAAASLEQARAYERGVGVVRDYDKAADIYRKACEDGHGQIAACGELIRAQLRARGADFDKARTRELAGAVCLASRDPFSCVAASLLSEREAVIPEPLQSTIKDVVSALEPCDVVHMSECHARWLAEALDPSGSASATKGRQALNLQLCRLGVVDGCVEAARHSHDDEVIAEAAHRLQAACDARDADACAAAPERRPMPPSELCAAHDYEACAQLGCKGDATARSLAAGHGVDTTSCTRFDAKHTAPHDPNEAVIAKMTEFKDKMCICTDKACTEQVTDEMTHWGQQEARRPHDHSEHFTEADTKAMAAVTEDMTKCMTEVMTKAAMTPNTP